MPTESLGRKLTNVVEQEPKSFEDHDFDWKVSIALRAIADSGRTEDRSLKVDGMQLRRIRRARALSQRDLARTSEVSR